MLNLPVISNKSFGIEVEFVGACPRHVAQVINSLEGVECSYAGYTHLTTSYWKVVYDGSLSGVRGHAGELVSPILNGVEGVRELERVIEALNSVEGVTVNRSCGLHVHLDCREMNINEIKTTYERYSNHEEQIDLCMPRSRRGSPRWCASTASVKNAVKRATCKPNAARAAERYYKVNLTNIASRGSIEFRQHSGTTEFKKIVNWLSFLMQFVESSIQMAGSTAVKPSAWYAQLKTLVGKWGGDFSYSKSTRSWNVVKNGVLVTRLSNCQISELYVSGSAMKSKGLRPLHQLENLLEVYGLPYSELMAAVSNPVTVSENDQGVYHGITTQIQDYLRERQEELS